MAFSDNLFKPSLTYGNVYSRSFALLMERLGLFMTIGALLVLPDLIKIKILKRALEFRRRHDEDATHDFLTMELIYLYVVFGMVIGKAAIALAVAKMYVDDGGHRPGIEECLAQGWKHKYTLLAGECLLALIPKVIGLGALFSGLAGPIVSIGDFLVKGYLAFASALFTAVVMVEGKSALDGLERSCDLLNIRNFWFFFRTSLPLSLLMGSILLMTSTLLLDVTANSYSEYLFELLRAILFVLSQAILYMVVYLDIRVTHEGLNRDVLAKELQSSAIGDYETFPDYYHCVFMWLLNAAKS